MNEIRAVGTRGELVQAIDSVPVKVVRAYVLSYMKRRAQRIHNLQERKKGMLRGPDCADPLSRMAQYLLNIQQSAPVAIPRKVAAL